MVNAAPQSNYRDDLVDDAHTFLSVHAVPGIILAVTKGITLPFSDCTHVKMIDAFTLTLTLPNLKSPLPYSRAAEQWEQIATALTEFESATRNALKSFDAAWDGPGADAFVNYVEGKLLPAAKELSEAATTVKSSCDSNYQGLIDWGWEPFFASAVTTLVSLALCKPLKGIPKCGEALYQAGVLVVSVAYCAAQLVISIYPLTQSFMSELDTVTSLATQYRQLTEQFQSQAVNFDAGSLERSRREVESVISDPSGWRAS